LTLSNAGAIYGDPSMPGSASLTVQATDDNGTSATKALSIDVFPAVELANSSLPAAVVGRSYTASLTTIAGTGKAPFSWALLPEPSSLATGPGSLAVPVGLHMDFAHGVISGTPLTAMSSTLTFGVTDILGGTAQRTLRLVVRPAQRTRSTPELSGLHETNTTFAVGSPTGSSRQRQGRPKRGTIFSFYLDRSATVRIAIVRSIPGRACANATKRRRAGRAGCALLLAEASLIRHGRNGWNRVMFDGRIGKKGLKAGHYEAIFIASARGAVSPPRTLRFTVVPR
jgi:hypothetical protein